MFILIVIIIGNFMLPYLFNRRSFWRLPKNPDFAQAKKEYQEKSNEVDQEIDSELSRKQEEIDKLNKIKNKN